MGGGGETGLQSGVGGADETEILRGNEGRRWLMLDCWEGVRKME